MSSLETLGASAGAGFLTSLVTLVFTLFGFNRRLERIEQVKLDQAICEARNNAVLNEIRQLRMDTSADLRALSSRIDRILNGHNHT
jgi:hypothetical protein